MVHPLIISSVVSAGVYATTKTITYLSTRPDQGATLYDLRRTLAITEERIQNYCGRYWSIFTHVYWDNLWISAFIISLMMAFYNPPLSLERVVNLFAFSFGVNVISWRIRYHCSSIFECIRPRMIND